MQTGFSEATVKRALGDYSGVNPNTKKIILDHARRLNFEFKLKPVDIAIIMPFCPAFFWKPLYQYVLHYVKQTGLTYKFYLYSEVNNDLEASNCMDTALRAGAYAMILSAPSTERIKQKIRTASQKVCVFLLEEWIDIDNVCFVGENSFQESYDLADKYLKQSPDSKVFLDVLCTVGDTKRRTQGFYSRLVEAGITDFTQIDLNMKNGEKLGIAITARKLLPYINKVDCIYCPSGASDLVLRAIEKLSKERRINVVYFEAKPTQKRPAISIGNVMAVAQDLDGQAKTVVSLAKSYVKTGVKPDKKCIYIPSQYI